MTTLSHNDLAALCRQLLAVLEADVHFLRTVRDRIPPDQSGLATEISYHVGGIQATINRAERELR